MSEQGSEKTEVTTPGGTEVTTTNEPAKEGGEGEKEDE